MNVIAIVMWACTGAPPAEPPAGANTEEPVEEPAPAPEPAEEPEAEPVMLAFGKACEDPAEGEPGSIEDVRAMLAEAGIEGTTVEQMPVCEACGTCPRLAVSILGGDAEAVKKTFASQLAE